ncbi:aquaporin AQPcic-like [Tropilaelaps mercedesae]|uniref:Aquaporin AQPcic-like n=1 Tax=Tropilaelaps mercedesae TaxID=418985 RepID=A0A1V9XT73_9ACAR|nr:aquaporin AQPcic-like [Tropilaelaps mercedesae]
MLVAGNISFVKGFFYVASQCIGAITGAAILQALTPAGNMLGNTTLANNVSALMGFFIEAVISFVLVMTVFGATDGNRLDVLGSVPLAIGLSITVCHLFAVPLTGASMNPARTFGPALILQNFENHHIYWLGPMLGGIAAGLIYRYAFSAPKPTVDELERAARLCCLAKMSGKEPDGGVTSF